MSPPQGHPSMKIGIVRETYNKWERRAPLTPDHVRALVSDGGTDVSVVVQPSSHRIFTDGEYEASGATISEDLGDCDVILGVKQVKEENLIADKTYVFFAHVIKGQAENMSLLRTILDRNIRLVDYECITRPVEDGTKPKRLVAFGRYAGIAGMIDMFQGLGQRLLASGFSTPFLHSPQTYIYRDLKEAKGGIERMGHDIATNGLPRDLEPLVFAFTGKGNVTKGAFEMFQLLPHEMLTLEELKELRTKGSKAASGSGERRVYGIMVKQEDLVARKDEYDDGSPFDSLHYRNNPIQYEATFHDKIAPYCNVIVNGIYWDERYPRIITKKQIKDLYEKGNKSLLAVADISCDVNGSVEFLEMATPIDQPFFQYDPIKGCVSDEIDANGITVMGVDILPTELARESTNHFGESLVPLLLTSAASYGDNGKLAPELEWACITSGGKLLQRYGYIEALMMGDSTKEVEKQSGPVALISLEGHLFDSGMINKTLDILTSQGSDYHITECVVGQKDHHKSSILIRIQAKSEEEISLISQKIETLADVFTAARASVHVYSGDATDLAKRPRTPSVSEKEETVLLIGAGRVASSVSEYLGRSSTRKIVVASALEHEVKAVARQAKNGKGVVLDVVHNQTALAKLIKDADVVVSLLPAPMHPIVAEPCIKHGKSLVTASYVSKEIREMDERCKEAGIMILNEMGLDPGMDHMSAMKIIDDIKARGGRVTSFSSVCGGLPAPEAANNPIQYKFSWSPMGVLRASTNSATYRRGDELVDVDGNELLASAKPFNALPGLKLECLPNRDSLIYESLYGIESAETIFRGTLRFDGFSGIMYVLKNAGLFLDEKALSNTWDGVLKDLYLAGGFSDLSACLLAASKGNEGDAKKAEHFLEWLCLDDVKLFDQKSIIKSFCAILEEKLKFEDSERDMVVMHHDIRADFDDGSRETHHSSLKVFGEDNGGMTAMCKTVGYTAAAGCELVLSGDLKYRTGIVVPTDRDIYAPVLASLEEEGLKFEETMLLDQTEETSSFM